MDQWLIENDIEDLVLNLAKSTFTFPGKSKQYWPVLFPTKNFQNLWVWRWVWVTFNSLLLSILIHPLKTRANLGAFCRIATHFWRNATHHLKWMIFVSCRHTLTNEIEGLGLPRVYGIQTKHFKSFCWQVSKSNLQNVWQQWLTQWVNEWQNYSSGKNEWNWRAVGR